MFQLSWKALLIYCLLKSVHRPFKAPFLFFHVLIFLQSLSLAITPLIHHILIRTLCSEWLWSALCATLLNQTAWPGVWLFLTGFSRLRCFDWSVPSWTDRGILIGQLWVELIVGLLWIISFVSHWSWLWWLACGCQITLFGISLLYWTPDLKRWSTADIYCILFFTLRYQTSWHLQMSHKSSCVSNVPLKCYLFML